MRFARGTFRLVVGSLLAVLLNCWRYAAGADAAVGDSIIVDMISELDRDRDGSVSLDEFAPGRLHGASETAFECLDVDGSGDVTREEVAKLRRDFYKSSLSKLDEQSLLLWVQRPECVPLRQQDANIVVASFRKAQLHGLLLWEVAVKQPSRLRDELDIHPAIARITLVHAVCREINGLGCLVAGAEDNHRDGPEQQQSHREPEADGFAQAFSCMDSDKNGQITRAELHEAYKLFRQSNLSRLSQAQMQVWLASAKCVGDDLLPFASRLQSLALSGNDLWGHVIIDPALLMSKLGEDISVQQRLHTRIAEHVCNEIYGHSCLDSNTLRPHVSWEGWWGGRAYWWRWFTKDLGALFGINGWSFKSCIVCALSICSVVGGIRSIMYVRAYQQAVKSASQRWAGPTQRPERPDNPGGGGVAGAAGVDGPHGEAGGGAGGRGEGRTAGAAEGLREAGGGCGAGGRGAGGGGGAVPGAPECAGGAERVRSGAAAVGDARGGQGGGGRGAGDRGQGGGAGPSCSFPGCGKSIGLLDRLLMRCKCAKCGNKFCKAHKSKAHHRCIKAS